MSDHTSPRDRLKNWHADAFLGIHYDLHANANDTELGADVTHEHLRERLQRLPVKPDWIQVDCKGHPGYTSWPTEVGSTSPGMVKDGLRVKRDVTKELGIKLGMHYSGVIDRRAIELHPEWARIDVNGQPDAASTCRMSGYTDELLIPQMLELIEKYDVDGFWVDGENWGSKPCWCERCRAEFTRRTGTSEIPSAPEQPGWTEWLAFHRALFVEHVRRYCDAVHAAKPDCLMCSNWMYTTRQPDAVDAPVDYLSGDYTASWGADRAAIEGRLLDGRSGGISWDLMVWSFSWPRGAGRSLVNAFKTATHLCQEVAEVVALGGAVMIYDHPTHRSGWLTSWHQDIMGEVFEFCQARKAVCFQSESVPQVGVLHLADHVYGQYAETFDADKDPALFTYAPALQPVEGALNALLETQRSTDLLTEEAALARMDPYALIVVPEQTHLSRDVIDALERYARNGGRVLMSGAHLARECPDLVGATPDGDPLDDRRVPWGDTHLPVRKLAVGVCGPWQPVTPTGDTAAWIRRLTDQEPVRDETDQVIVTHRVVGRGSVTAVHGPIFQAYFDGHYPALRWFIEDLVMRLPIAWDVTADGPPRLEMVLRQKAGKLMVNLLNRGSGETLSPNRTVIEELPPVHDVTLRIRRASRPQSVTAVPAETELRWTYSDGTVTVEVPRVDIHTVVVVE